MNSFETQGGDQVRRVSENDAKLQGLRPFSSLSDYEWETGIPDVRNWVVKDVNGNRIGKVDDIMVDPDQMRVRYIDVDLRDSASPEGGDYHLLIPIGAAQIDENEDEIRAVNLTKEQLTGYPRYNREPINRDYEQRIRNYFGFDKDRSNADLQAGTHSDFSEYTEGVSRTTHLMDDTPTSQTRDVEITNDNHNRTPDTINSDLDKDRSGTELSDFATRHMSPPDTRENASEPGSLTGTDFYTDSHFDETRFYGHRYSGQRRGGISTFPEGEGRFTFRRRNI